MTSSTDAVPAAPGLNTGEREFVHAVAEHYRDTDNMAWEHGYLIGWLLISDPVEQTSSALCETLGVSPESVEHISRLLVAPGILDRRELAAGEYALTLRHDAWPKVVQHALVTLPDFHAVMEEGVRALAGASDLRRRRVENMERFYRYLGTEIPAVFDRYPGPIAES